MPNWTEFSGPMETELSSLIACNLYASKCYILVLLLMLKGLWIWLTKECKIYSYKWHIWCCSVWQRRKTQWTWQIECGLDFLHQRTSLVSWREMSFRMELIWWTATWKIPLYKYTQLRPVLSQMDSTHVLASASRSEVLPFRRSFIPSSFLVHLILDIGKILVKIFNRKRVRKR